MTMGFPAALPPPLSSLRRGEGDEEDEEGERRGPGMDGDVGKEAIEIVIMSVNSSGWPPAPQLFNNPIITGPLLSERGDPSSAAAAAAEAECCLPASGETSHRNIREDRRVSLSGRAIQGACFECMLILTRVYT